MGFSGQTFRIPCNRGGFTYNPNIDNIDPVMMVEGTKNINIHQGGRESRGGTSHVYGAALSGGPQINGIYDFTQTDGTQHILATTVDGKIWKDDTTTIKTGLTAGANIYYQFEVMNDEVYISNGQDRPQVWDGSAGATTNLSAVPVDWSGSSVWPTQILKHGRGNSERMWAILPGNNNLYYSVLNDGVSEADFSGAGSGQIYIETGNEGGLTALVEFGDQLIAFTRKRAYIIDDTDASAANWGYIAAPFVGGAPHHRLIVKTDNDVVCMMEDGVIYSFTTVQQAQDYKMAALTRPAFIDKWIRDKISRTAIVNCHAEYDPTLRLIKFFLLRQGAAQIDTALVYSVDRGPEEGWMIHDNLDSPSGYSAASSALVRVSAGNYKVYTGDYSGNLWELETNSKDDNSNAFYAGFTTPFIGTENIRTTKKFYKGWVLTQAKGDYNLKVKATIDTNSYTAQDISLQGVGGILDMFVLDVDVLGGNEVLDVSFDIRNIGRRIAFDVYNSNANEDYFVSQLMFDYKFLGARPQ